MTEQSVWVKRRMACPEGRGETKLLLEWRVEAGREVLNSIHCHNIRLRDLSGEDCAWSCWEKVTRE